MKSESTAVIIEARFCSTRLPGKVMMDICGQPLIKRLIDRLKLSNNFSKIILATSTNKEDEQLVDLAISEKINFFRGSENDVLGRVTNAAKKFKVETIINICGDCPLIDPGILDTACEVYKKKKYDVVFSGFNVQSFPQGTELAVYSSKILFKIEKEAQLPKFREHTCQYILKNENKFTVFNLLAEKKDKMPNLRLQVDFLEDINFVREIYERLLPKYGYRFTVSDVINLIKKNHFLTKINKNCVEKKI